MAVRDGTARLRKWWSEKYGLPPNHPLFLELSSTELHQEMYEDLLMRRDELKHEVEEGGDRDVQRRLADVEDAIGDVKEESDDLIARWEAELDAGFIPDLDEQPE